MASYVYHTNGTALIKWGGVDLGLASSDGVKISINQYFNEIYSDQLGPKIPATVLRNGCDARIEVELWKYDTNVMLSIIAQRDGGVAGQLPAQPNQVGQLMFENGLTSTLAVLSPVDGQNWLFANCWLLDESSVQLSTQLKIWTCVFRATPAVYNGVLYTFI